MKSKAMNWLFLIAGVLWLLAGLRDVFAPGFFSINGRVVTGCEIGLEFAVAAVFIALAGYGASKTHYLKDN